jgi:hypothetical protein
MGINLTSKKNSHISIKLETKQTFHLDILSNSLTALSTSSTHVTTKKQEEEEEEEERERKKNHVIEWVVSD